MILRAALTAGKRLHAVLRANSLLRMLLLGFAAVIVPVVVILILLELDYREEVARELSVTFTGSVASTPFFDPPKIQFEPKREQWTPLAPPVVLLGPPTLPTEGQPTGSTQNPTQSAVAVRDPTPLPRPRPNRF